ncbi:MAG: iron-containing alcohol dehydrogenase [Myxococcota bacterium]
MADEAIDRSLSELTREAGDAPGKTRHIVVQNEIGDAVATWLGQSHPGKLDILVCDENTKAAAAESLAARLQLSGRRSQLLTLPTREGEDHVVCDEAIIDALTEQLRQMPDANAIAVGAGTINDIVKMATFKLGRGYQSVATAASMNGYTSAIAAVLSRGVKRTLPAQQAEAVFADPGVIGRAPAYLNRAGFGDLLSKPYSNADWLLSHYVRGVAYEERPAKLLDEAYVALLERASAVGRGEASGIGTLTRTILLSGFTMAIAGTSAPASGGEHLVSHYWDMEQHCHDEALFGLHGTQVGVATRMSAMLFERLVSLAQDDIDVDAAVKTRGDASWLETLGARHERLTPAVVEEVRAQITAKQKHGDALHEELTAVRERWPEIRAGLEAVLIPSARMGEVLAAAGAADRPSALKVDRAHAVRTLRVCREIRSRYVALDLIADLGHLDGWAAEVVDAVEAA